MAYETGIEWADSTWNPWRGCTKVSAGCKNCYMFRDQRRFGHDPQKIVRASDRTFYRPLDWRGKPRRIFVCSWSDFAHEDVPQEWIEDAWFVMRNARCHAFMILTKRPQELRYVLPPDWGDGWSHVWLGVTVENEDNLWRLHELERIPALVKFVSCEPLLGPLPNLYSYLPMLDWVIVGGESGPGARLMQSEWVRDIRDQCAERGKMFFFKQWGGTKRVDGTWGGNLLDGKRHQDVPEILFGLREMIYR